MHRSSTLRPLVLFGPVLLFILATATNTWSDGPVRVWVDKTGSHSIEASFVEVRGERVVLLKRNGQSLSIALDQLSDIDAEYVEKKQQDVVNQLRLSAPSIADIEPLEELDLPQADSQLPDNAELILESGGKPLELEDLPSSLSADPSPHRLALPTDSFETGKIHNFTMCSVPFAVGSPQAPLIGLSVCDGFSNPGKPASNRIVRFDPDSGESQVLLRTKNRIRMLDHHLSSGRSLVLEGHNSLGQGGRLAIATGWDTGEFHLMHHRTLPGNRRIAEFPQVRWARWIDDENVIAVIDNRLVSFNLLSGEQNYAISGIAAKATPDISGGKRYVAIPFEGGADLISTRSGQHLGRIRSSLDAVPSVSFSNQSHALAIVNTRRMIVWDLQAATLMADVTSRRSLGTRAPVWVDSDLVMVGSGALVSLFRGVTVWQYDIAGCERVSLGGRVAILRKHPQSTLNLQSLPHPGAQQAIHWIDAVKATASADNWRIPGRSEWINGEWRDKGIRAKPPTESAASSSETLR